MPKINQILAVERPRKTAVHKSITELHRLTQQPALMTGHLKVFAPKDDGGETYPPDERKVQHLHQDVIERLSTDLSSLLDVVATKDWSNCKARADVVLDGAVFLEGVPVTYLLFLEKELNDLHTFVSKMVELDPAQRWTFDENSGQYRSDSTTTHKTKKIQRPIVLYDATPEHPAQTQLITEDAVIGHWTTTHYSGAIPRPKKQRILERITALQDAVKFAREQANSMEADERRIGRRILDYVLKDDR